MKSHPIRSFFSWPSPSGSLVFSFDFSDSLSMQGFHLFYSYCLFFVLHLLSQMFVRASHFQQVLLILTMANKDSLDRLMYDPTLFLFTKQILHVMWPLLPLIQDNIAFCSLLIVIIFQVFPGHFFNFLHCPPNNTWTILNSENMTYACCPVIFFSFSIKPTSHN